MIIIINIIFTMSSAEENISPSNRYVSFIKKELVNEGKYTIPDLEKELKMVLLEYGKVFNVKLINTSDPNQYLIDINIELYNDISKNIHGKIKTRFYDRFKQFLTISKNYKSYTSTPTSTKLSPMFHQEKLNDSINFIKLDNIKNIKRYRNDEDDINTSSVKYVCDRNNQEQQQKIIQEQEQQRLIQEQEQQRLIQEQEKQRLIQEQQRVIQEQEQEQRLIQDYNLNLVLKDSYGTDLVITRSFFPAYFLLSSYRHNIRKNCVEKFNSIEDLLTAELNYSNIKFTPLYMHGIESFSFNHFINS